MSTTNDRVKKSKVKEFVPAGNGQEDELIAFINSLIDQNAELAAKLQNIDSLMELADKVVMEAGKEAERIKLEAEREANARAAAIIARAVEKAKAAAQKVVAKAKEKSEAEGRRIIDEARCRAEERAKERLSLAEQQAPEVLKAAEQNASYIIAEAKEKTEQAALKVSAEKPSEQPSFSQEEGEKKESADSYEETVELTLQPPVALDRILQLHKQLKKNAGAKVVDLKGSLDKGVRIKLQVQSHIPLLSMLAALPEVEKVSDEPLEGKISSSNRKGDGACPRAIAVTMKR